MKRIATIFLLFVFLTTGCNDEPSTPAEARQRLSELGIKFNPNTFVSSARSGNEKTIKLFLKAGMDLYVVNSRENTALMYASMRGDLNMVNFILDETVRGNPSSNINIQNKDGNTALAIAIKENHDEIIDILIEFGVSPNLLDNDFNQATHVALKGNKIEILKKLLNNPLTDINAKNGTSETLLMQAVRQKNEEAVALLLDAGIDPNIPARGNITPLMVACEKGNINIVKMLIKAGSELNAYNIQGGTPFIIALKKNNLDLVDVLIINGVDVNFSKTGKMTPLQAAIESSDTNNELLYNLIANGVEIPQGQAGRDVLKATIIRGDIELIRGLTENTSITDVELDEETLITFAIKNGNEKITIHFIESSKNPNKKNKSKETPLELAVYKAYSDVVDLLIKKGADVDGRCRGGRKIADIALGVGNAEIMDLVLQHSKKRTPNRMMVRAIYAGKEDLVKVFLKYGAKPNTYNAKGQSLLWMAASKGMTDGLEALIKAGAKINSGDKVDKTPPLSIAAALGHTDTMKILINSGANRNLRDLKGFTPLIHAVRNIQLASIKMLIKAGANVNIRDEAGRTALSINERGAGSRWVSYNNNIKEILKKAGAKK